MRSKQDTPIRPAEDIASPTEATVHERINPALPPILVFVWITGFAASSAMIDRKMWNWLPTATVLVFGTVLVAAGVHFRRIARSRNSQVAHQART